MPKIAIFKLITSDCVYCNYSTISTSLDATEFTEVTDDELKILKLSSEKNKYSSKNAFYIVELPIDQQKFVKKTVDDYIKEEKNRLEKEALDKKLREEKKRKSDLTKLAKSKEQKKALLEQLKQELGEIDG